METDKSRAERLMSGLFDRQGTFKKRPLPYDENLKHGIRSVGIYFEKERSRWEIKGKSVDKLIACLLLDRAFEEGKIKPEQFSSSLKIPQTESEISKAFFQKVEIELESLYLWRERSSKINYDEEIAMYEGLKQSYLDCEPIDLYLTQVRTADYDHSKDPKITIKYHQSFS